MNRKKKSERRNSMKGRKNMLGLFVVTMVLSILLLGGCGGGFSALPKEKISESDKALIEAKGSNATVNAPVELKAAEDKLEQAKAAFGTKDYDTADRLAEQALADTEICSLRVTRIASAVTNSIRHFPRNGQMR